MIILESKEKAKISELRADRPQEGLFLKTETVPSGREFFELIEAGFTGVLHPESSQSGFEEGFEDLALDPRL